MPFQLSNQRGLKQLLSNTSTGFFDSAAFSLFFRMFFHVSEEHSVGSSPLPLSVKFSQELCSDRL